MGWTKVEKRFGRNCVNYGPHWQKFPCVAVTKQGLTLNSFFLEAFKQTKNEVMVFIDAERRKVGLKFPADDEANGAFRIQNQASKGGNTRSVCCKLVSKSFPDCVGFAFRAHLNAGERIIEIDLSPSNKA